MGGVEMAMILPLAMLIPIFLVTLAKPGSKYGLLLILFMVSLVTAHYVARVSSENFSGNAYQAGRMEFYTFSLHVAKNNPFLGVGLRTPRDSELSNYNVWHPALTNKQFAVDVKTLVTSQNIFLTFVVGFGVPFGLLYLGAVTGLYVRLMRFVWHPPPEQVVPPMALVIPITGAVLHFMSMDIMLMPQIAWFFHVLLGMIPFPTKVQDKEKTKISPRIALKATTAIFATALLGILVGTHPTLATLKIPSMDQLRTYMTQIPILAPILAARTSPPHDEGSEKGSLVIHLEDFERAPLRHKLLFLFDNSPSMSKTESPWDPSRLKAGLSFLESVRRTISTDSRIGIRAFAMAGPFISGEIRISPRVSTLLFPWREAGMGGVPPDFPEEFSPGLNDMCSALHFSIQRDFMFVEPGLSPRIAVITDGQFRCPLGKVFENLSQSNLKNLKVMIDVIAVGMDEVHKRGLVPMVNHVGGIWIDLNNPSHSLSEATRYVRMLPVATPRSLMVQKGEQRYEVYPGRSVSLPAGQYSLRLSDPAPVSGKSQEFWDIYVAPKATSVYQISVRDGEVSVKAGHETPD